MDGYHVTLDGKDISDNMCMFLILRGLKDVVVFIEIPHVDNRSQFTVGWINRSLV